MLQRMDVVEMEAVSGGANIFDGGNYGSYPREDGSTAHYQPSVSSDGYIVYTTRGTLVPTGGSGPDKKITLDNPTGGSSIDFSGERFTFTRKEVSPTDLAKDMWRAGEHQKY